jgi:hypothetical protein
MCAADLQATVNRRLNWLIFLAFLSGSEAHTSTSTIMSKNFGIE